MGYLDFVHYFPMLPGKAYQVLGCLGQDIILVSQSLLVFFEALVMLI